MSKKIYGRSVTTPFNPNKLGSGGLTTEQITVLDNMFKVCTFAKDDVSAEYNAFKAAFGIGGEVEPDEPIEPGETHSHSYTSAVTKAATCTTTGVRTYTCSCGHSYTESIPATGHNYVDGVCSVCGAADPNAGTEVTLIEVESVAVPSLAADGSYFKIQSSANYVTVVANLKPNTDYKVVASGSYNRFRLYGHAEEIDLDAIQSAKYGTSWAVTSIYKDVDTITEYEFNSGSYKSLFWYLASGITFDGITATVYECFTGEVPSSISATYSGGDVSVGTVVADLTGIVVTAHYSDGSTATVTDYTLSGTIAEGSNTVTVSYGGKTTTFTVTGVAAATETLSVFKYRDSGWPTTTDNGDGTRTMDLGATNDTGSPGYWTIIFPGEISGGVLSVKFNKTITSGNIQIVMYGGIKNGDDLLSNITMKTSKGVWYEYSATDANTVEVNADTDFEIPSGIYPLIMVRNGNLMLEGDTTSTNVQTAAHIRDGDITFSITGNA